MQTFGQHLKHLLQVQATLPANSQLRAFIDQIADTVANIINIVQPIQNESYSGATPNKDFILQANVAFLDAAMKVAITNATKYDLDPQKLQELMNDVASLDTRIQLQQQPEVQKATTAAIKGIQLNTRGEFVVKDKEIKAIADNFAKRFGLKPIWARNLIGMFDISIPHEDRVKFLKACEEGKALDIHQMITKGQGSIEDVVTTKIPKLREVFSSIKETLLDISLSTGQRGATGPFEALVAIMGGGRKPTTQEGGDIVVKSGGKDLKLELKAGSITIKSATGKVSGLSPAWLDSTAGGEISPSKLRSVADTWLNQNFPLAFKNAQLSSLWKDADFRPTKLENFKFFLEYAEKKKPGMSTAFIGSMMATMFPSITNVPGYDFKKAVKNIVHNIALLDSKAIAREQGVMALLEYVVGKGNDGFLLFNGSTQEYKMIMGVKGVLQIYKSNEIAPESSIVRFDETMTMLAKSTKCSPSIYFGPSNTSNRAKEYANKFMSNPERVALRAKAEAAGDPEFEPDTSDVAVPPPRAKRTVGATSPAPQRRT
jgi:hypothetical protein